MKRKPIFKIFICMFVVVFMFQISPYVFAHPSSQEGILTKTYHTKYKDYYIGGEDIGWSIDENYHTNGTALTYSFSSDPDLNSTYKSHVLTGASRWNGIVTITNKADGSGTGSISTFYNPDTSTVAVFKEYSSNNSGHLTSWKIEMNRAKNVSSTTLAHEFGHVIGLNDLYDTQNINKLMYGYTSSTATMPSASDKWGAKVITGQHTSHTWSYKYHNTTSAGNNQHITSSCTSCGGIPVQKTISNCIYNANNVCRICGTPAGYQPWSAPHLTQ